MPLYPLSKQVLLSLALSFTLVSCGDGGTDPADLIDVTIVSAEPVNDNGTLYGIN